MIFMRPKQRSVRIIPSHYILLFAVGLVCSVAWLWMGLHLLAGLGGVVVSGALLVFFVGRSAHVRAFPDGTVLVSYLIGSTLTLQKPRVNAKYRHNSYDIELGDGTEHVELIEREHATMRGNAKLGVRFAETLGLELHPQLEAWLIADANVR